MSNSLYESSGRILIVDDNATKRLKLKKAVIQLGHQPFEASGGRQSLEMLSKSGFDLLLLDLQMPDVDGYQVLQAIKDDDLLSDIPVIVISSLDNIESVTRAISLGAEDYLDDHFHAAILDARITVCLERKRRRDQERLLLQRIETLTLAAEKINSGENNPDALGLQAVIANDDSLGKFATMFSAMSEQIFKREKRLNNQVRTLKNVLLLFLTGAVLGIGMPLSRIVSELSDHPFGIALWVNVLAGVIGIAVALIRKCLPAVDKQLLFFLAIWGVITASGFVLIFWVASHLSASALSIVMVTEGFAVFVIAALFRIEQASPKRLFGLLLGFVGIILLIASQKGVEGAEHWIWLVLALLVPLNFASEDLFLAARMPPQVDAVASVGLVSVVSALMLLPATYILGDFVALKNPLGKLELTVLLLALKSLLGLALLIKLVTAAGAVFGSQVGYVKAFAGIVWSMLILSESLHWIAWVSFGIILAGLLLVDSGNKEHDVEQLVQARG